MATAAIETGHPNSQQLDSLSAMQGLLAHMGGIDEIGIFLVPAVLAIIVLRRVERKAREKEAERAAAAPEPQ